MQYTVSRQNSWGVELPLAVEVSAGGRDYVNPDAFSPKYPGELQTYDTAIEAVNAAIEIRKLWRQDKPGETIRLDCGQTLGGAFPLTDDMTDEEALTWASNQTENMEDEDADYA